MQKEFKDDVVKELQRIAKESKMNMKIATSPAAEQMNIQINNGS